MHGRVDQQGRVDLPPRFFKALAQSPVVKTAERLSVPKRKKVVPLKRRVILADQTQHPPPVLAHRKAPIEGVEEVPRINQRVQLPPAAEQVLVVTPRDMITRTLRLRDEKRRPFKQLPCQAY